MLVMHKIDRASDAPHEDYEVLALLALSPTFYPKFHDKKHYTKQALEKQNSKDMTKAYSA